MLLTFANSLDPDQDGGILSDLTGIQTDKMLVLIWIQNVWHSVSVPERIIWETKMK